jgi:hypothetical protein
MADTPDRAPAGDAARSSGAGLLRAARPLFSTGYTAVAVLFFCCGAALIVLAALELWTGIDPSATLARRERFNAVLEAIAVLTIAVAALELGQTVIEEEVMRQAHMSAPTRVRRFLSRFLIVVVVALSVETLVAAFRLVHEDPEQLPRAASMGYAAAALLAAWGLFIWLNRAAEELEPAAMESAKREDQNVE